MDKTIENSFWPPVNHLGNFSGHPGIRSAINGHPPWRHPGAARAPRWRQRPRPAANHGLVEEGHRSGGRGAEAIAAAAKKLGLGLLAAQEKPPAPKPPPERGAKKPRGDWWRPELIWPLCRGGASPRPPLVWLTASETVLVWSGATGCDSSASPNGKCLSPLEASAWHRFG
jgi:hypothetical protein